MNRRDLALFLVVLALAGGLLIANRLAGNSTSGRTVEVYVDGALYATAALGTDREIRVEQPNGALNIIQLTDHGFWMAYSNCPNQLCVAQGKVTEENFHHRALGNHILCLPNRVDVVLALSEDEEKDRTDG